MAYTPVEIRHVKLQGGLLGYRRAPVERLLADVADSFEEVWRERADLTDRIEHLEGDVERYKELEHILRATLVSAERAAHELRSQANREAEAIVSEARAEARAIGREVRVEHEQLLRSTQHIRLLLRATLDALDEVEEPRDDAPEAPSTAEAA